MFPIYSRYTRDWRYHRDDRVWITRAPGMVPSEKTNTYERGTYYFFDVQNWRSVIFSFTGRMLPFSFSSVRGLIGSFIAD